MKKYFIAMVAGLMMAAGGAFAEGFSGSVGVMNDYVFRGVSQNNQHMSFTGNVDYSIGNLSVGVAATEVDNTGDQVELNAIANYRFTVSDSMSVDVGAIYYAYPGVHQFNMTEVNSAVNFNTEKVTSQVKVSYTNDYGVTGNHAWYGEVNGAYLMTKRTSLIAHVGYTDVNKFGTMTDYKVGVTHQFGKSVTGEVAFVDTNVTGVLSDSRWTVAARYQF